MVPLPSRDPTLSRESQAYSPRGMLTMSEIHAYRPLRLVTDPVRELNTGLDQTRLQSQLGTAGLFEEKPCTRNCRCQCHRTLLWSTDTCSRILLGDVSRHIPTIGIYYRPTCTLSHCKRESVLKVEIKFQFPLWLWERAWTLQWLQKASYGDWNVSIFASNMFERRSVTHWIRNPVLLRQELEQGFECSPDDNLNSGELLLEVSVQATLAACMLGF